MEVKERLLLFVKYKKISVKRFEELCGVSNGYVSAIRKSIGGEKLNNVLKAFPELNREWLLYGEGEMLKEENLSMQCVVHRIPIIPLYACTVGIEDFTEAANKDNCEMIVSPLKNVDFAIRVSGNSMEPEYPNGSIVLIKKIDPTAFIDYSKVYVLNTVNGIVIKQLEPGTSEDNLTCVSLNQKYADFVVDKKDIFGIYVVCMVMIMK